MWKRPVVTPRVRYMNSYCSLYCIVDIAEKKPKKFHRIHSSGIPHSSWKPKNIFAGTERQNVDA